MIHLFILLITCVLIVDALAGEKGFLDTMRARREFNTLQAEIARLEAENARLREEARKLREDPRTIEEIAREELGLVREGEILFVVKDAPAPAGAAQ